MIDCHPIQKIIFSIAFLLMASPVFSQCNRQAMDSIRKLSEKDHKRMMPLLGIDSLRPGVNGINPNAPDAANYDEAKASPYPLLPDLLILRKGKKVTNAKTWRNRHRAEIMEDFDREMYSRTPKQVPGVQWKIISTQKEMNGAIPVITKKLLEWVDNSGYPSIHVNIQLSVFTPADAHGPVPLIMELAFVFSPGMTPPQDIFRNALPDWKQQVLQKGWGYAVLIPTSVQAHHRTGLTGGIIGLVNKGTLRKPDDWSAGKALDYLENDKDIDTKRAGIEEVDGRGLFMAAKAAGAENRMLGERDLGTTVFPAVEIALTDGDITFRQHNGGHTPGPNWPTFLQLAKRYGKK